VFSVVRDGTWNVCVGMLTLTQICTFGLPVLDFVVVCCLLWLSEVEKNSSLEFRNTGLMPYSPNEYFPI